MTALFIYQRLLIPFDFINFFSESMQTLVGVISLTCPYHISCTDDKMYSDGLYYTRDSATCSRDPTKCPFGGFLWYLAELCLGCLFSTLIDVSLLRTWKKQKRDREREPKKQLLSERKWKRQSSAGTILDSST